MANVSPVLPFGSLTDNSIKELYETDKSYFENIFENNGFNDYIKENGLFSVADGLSSIKCNYYTIDSSRRKIQEKKQCLKIINLNIRRVAANMAELILFLSNMEIDFDIIILSEIGDDAENYLISENFPGYLFFFNTPKILYWNDF